MTLALYFHRICWDPSAEQRLIIEPKTPVVDCVVYIFMCWKIIPCSSEHLTPKHKLRIRMKKEFPLLPMHFISQIYLSLSLVQIHYDMCSKGAGKDVNYVFFTRCLLKLEMLLENLFWNRLIFIYNYSKLREYWKDECKYAEKIPTIEMGLYVLSDGFLGYINLVWGHYMDNLLLSKVVCQVTRH